MYLKVSLLFIFLVLQLIQGEKKAIKVKFDPKPFVETLRSIFDTEYMQQLADVIAEKAAKRFIDEVMKNIDDLNISSDRPERMGGRQITKNRKDIKVMDKEEAMQMLKTPSPDGDNLGELSEESTLSKEKNVDKKKIPVIGLMKINGIYYRRYLGLL